MIPNYCFTLKNTNEGINLRQRERERKKVPVLQFLCKHGLSISETLFSQFLPSKPILQLQAVPFADHVQLPCTQGLLKLGQVSIQDFRIMF